MKTTQVYDGNNIPVLLNRCRYNRFPIKYHIGINFYHFFENYLFGPTSFCANYSALIDQTEGLIIKFISSLRLNNIEPVFCYDGIIHTNYSYLFGILAERIMDIFKREDVIFIRCISYADSQLTHLFEEKCINAIFSSCSVALHHIKSWIHNIDLEKQEIIVYSADNDTIESLLLLSYSHYHIYTYFEGFESFLCTESPVSKVANINSIVLPLITQGILTPPFLSKPMNNMVKYTFLTIPRNTLSYLTSISNLYFTLFSFFSKLPFSCLKSQQDSPRFDEFLSFLLVQTPLLTFYPINKTIITNILAAQNIVSRRFSTLFETMHSISTKATSSLRTDSSNMAEMVLSESLRRFLTAHEYIAPGGGLSPWGRALLVANCGNDDPTMLFIELVRADAMDAEYSSTPSNSGIGVTDIIERTLSLFPTTSKPPASACRSVDDSFSTIARMVHSSLRQLVSLNLCSTFYDIIEDANIITLQSIIGMMPLNSFNVYTTGALIRFLLENDNNIIEEYLNSVENYELLQIEVVSAFNWWNNLFRATKELKQRSLRPNSRVSNLKNFLMLFECANEFMQRRIPIIQGLLQI